MVSNDCLCERLAVPREQHHSNKVLFDSQWIVRCAAAADCADFKDTLGGSFE